MSVPETPVPAARPPKPHLTIREQLALLRSRGMIIADSARAADCLRRVGYYRLIGYWKPFQAGCSGDLERFSSGADFSEVFALYVFDKRLRLTLLDALERIEIALRAEIAYHMGAKDPLAHRNQSLLHPNVAARHDEWLAAHDRDAEKSREPFAAHHREHYGGEMPIWAATELWSFGGLSKFYALMRGADQRAVSAQFGVENARLMANWLRGMAVVRNIAAHHGRLWNRGVIGRLSPRGKGKFPDGFNPPMISGGRSHNRLYAVLCVIVFLIRQILPDSQWPRRLREALLKFYQDTGRNLGEMGFPPKWESSPFWRK